MGKLVSPRESPPHECASPSLKQRRTRSRIACDACHFQHARCDRVFPCSRCTRKGIQCGCNRELRKRGRIPKHVPKLISSILEDMSGTYTSDTTLPESQFMISPVSSTQTPEDGQQSPCDIRKLSTLPSPSFDYPESLDDMLWPAQRSVVDIMLNQPIDLQHASAAYANLLTGSDLVDAPLLPDPFKPREFLEGSSPKQCGSESEATTTPQHTMSSVRYPVLQPLLPFIEPSISGELACGLLDLYFTSAFPRHMHPVCHHIHCYVLRKVSCLDQNNPRPTSPALLASMLWVAALDDRAFALPISQHYRRQICQFLHSLAIHLLKPLTHTPWEGPRKSTSDNPVFLGTESAGPPLFAHRPTMTGSGQGMEFPRGTIDDVITYMHIASIFSASEEKALSMRWWYAAFSLARELKLNREIEAVPITNIQSSFSSKIDNVLDFSVSNRCILNCVCNDTISNITEEQREERRRVWWLLYIMDRHLALCYNHPLVLLDSESKDLLLPLDERTWQNGEIHSNSRDFTGPQCLLSGHKNMRHIFPDYACHDLSIFGFFLPLMVIMGQVVDLNQMKNHPILGAGTLGKETLDAHRAEVLRQLDAFEKSLAEFTLRNNDAEPSSSHADHATEFSHSQDYWISQTIAAYASYYVHILHILLTGRWDPVTLIEDKDFWTSSPDFASTISRALKAADSVKQILKFDPDITFMPDFFGIQLLQGSFHFLLIVERLQDKAGERFLSACEVMIRATESCIVTLNTEYQRNFCQVMRSAVAQARGRPVNHCEIRRRHMAILALYRWTGAGTGLAL